MVGCGGGREAGSRDNATIQGMETEPVTPDAVEPAEQPERAIVEADMEDDEEPAISQPTKIIRIASMTRAMLEELRQAPVDPAGRQRLLEIHDRSIEELKEVMSADLQEEFDEIFQPLSSETPSESELRIAQAQLVGWLEGLFHGIQATLFAQQTAARQQLEQMQRAQALPPGVNPQQQQGGGVYL